MKGTVTISGAIRLHRVCSGGNTNAATTAQAPVQTCTNYPGTGEIDIFVNGRDYGAAYAKPATSSSLASSLAQTISQGSSGTLTATASSNVITITQTAAGAGFSLSASESSDYGSPDDFSVGTSGASLSGGSTNADNGTVSVTLGSVTEKVPYGASDTALTIGQALAAAFYNDCNSHYQTQTRLDDTTGNANLEFIYRPGGAGDGSSLSATSTSTNTAFSGSSFTVAFAPAVASTYATLVSAPGIQRGLSCSQQQTWNALTSDQKNAYYTKFQNYVAPAVTAARTKWANSQLNTFGSQGSGNSLVKPPLINSASTYRVASLNALASTSDPTPRAMGLATADSTTNPQPNASYFVSPSLGDIPFQVQASGPAPKGPPYSQLIINNQWDFGDGTVVRVINSGSASHVYTIAGTFYVRFCSYNVEFPGPCSTSVAPAQTVRTVDPHGSDSDKDGLPDNLENTLSSLLNPYYHVSGGEQTSTQFATFLDQTTEAVAALHGHTPIDHIRVAPYGFGLIGSQEYALVRLDYLTLWNKDDGIQISDGCTEGLSLIEGLIGFSEAELLQGTGAHSLDNERAAILIAAPTSNDQLVLDRSQYKIASIYAAAHEWTIFDHSTYADATGAFSTWLGVSGPISQGLHVNLWLSRAKHPSYFANPAGESLFTDYQQEIAYSTLLLLYENGTISDIDYYIYLTIAEITFNGCITEKFSEAGLQAPQSTINVGEVSMPLNGSHFILDPSLEPKLTVPIF